MQKPATHFMHNSFFLIVIFFLLAISLPAIAGKPAIDFNLPTLPASFPDAEYDNTSISLAELKGRVVYLDFWATWCPPCRKSFPWMDEMYLRYKEAGLIVVAVSVDKKKEPLEKFIAEMKPHFPIAHDPAGKLSKQYKIRGMPTSYLIDRKGNIASTHIGFRHSAKKKMEAEIKFLLDL